MKVPDGRLRLDRLLAERGLARSRAHAADAIRRGAVLVAGEPARRPGLLVAADAVIDLDPEIGKEVSRAGAKLAHGLGHFGIDPKGLVSLDLGASTGGFTQVLLERGAARVYAVDVGAGQLDPAIAVDPRVVNLERTDARNLTTDLVPEPAGLIVADVSFISLQKALPAALALAAAGASLVALVKPQFELGPGVVGRTGVVRDPDLIAGAVARIAGWLVAQGWTVRATTPAPIAGKAGNSERLIAAMRADDR